MVEFFHPAMRILHQLNSFPEAVSAGDLSGQTHYGAKSTASRTWGRSNQKFLHLLPRQGFGERAFVAEDGLDCFALLLLQS